MIHACIEDDVLVVRLDRPGSRVNLIDEAWLAAMTEVVDRAEKERPRGLVLASAKPGQFIAGADVAAIAALESEDEARAKSRLGQELLDRIEDLPFPTIAAINGACLGGGLETVLAFRRRVAADDDAVQLGLPEVRLGILPGFGGTWRLPRTVGISAALPLVLSGKSVRARKALALGLVDRLTAPELLERVAREMALSAGAPRPRSLARRASDALLGRTPPGRMLLAAVTRRAVRRESGGHYPAPFEIVRRVTAGFGAPREAAMRAESEAFGRLAVTPVARNLLFLFRGAEALARHPWTGAESPPDREFSRAAVIGAGTMGGGIAGALAETGIAVRLKDVGAEALRVGLVFAAAPLERRVRRRSLSPRERDAVLARISPTTGDTGLARADVVIEAVPEVLELKIRVFRDLEGRVPRSAMLATNTSSLPVASIAAGLDDPGRLVGMHFFNPVHRMPLVEIIPGAETRSEMLGRAVGLVRRLKKTPVVVGDRPGFLVNRLLLPYLNEAALAVEEGWPPEAVDRALVRFGMPMGPLQVLDEVGLDVAAKVAGVLEAAFGERARPAGLLHTLLGAGALGTKAGRGFWTLRDGKRRPNRADLPPPRSAPGDEEIVERLLSGMINEAARCLAERVAAERDHLDLATVLGSGFPPFRGGIARWAGFLGQEEVRRRLERLAARYGARFAPAAELPELFA
ncbi:MAG: 3-hydroxyacyl-CoA dehydrogenase NAD-binding domain-containing protein [Candidatus Eiseniibacteriota bacterium]